MKKRVEIEKFEKDVIKGPLPDWFKSYILANRDVSMDDYPIATIFYGMKRRPILKRIVDDPV